MQHNQPITEKNLFKLNRRINDRFRFLPFPHYPWPAFWLQQDLGPINLCPSPTHPSDNTYRHGLDIATAILMYLQLVASSSSLSDERQLQLKQVSKKMVEMLWLFGGDVMAHWWRCFGSLAEM